MNSWRTVSVILFVLIFGSFLPNVLTQQVCDVEGAQPLLIRYVPNCPAGYYCPNIVPGNFSTYPQVCSPTESCQMQRFRGEFCPAQGLYEPTVCRPGYFCSNWTVEEICPARYYCPIGSSEPTKCSWLAYCPEGSRIQIYYGGVVLLVILDAIIMGLYFLVIKFEKKAAHPSEQDEETQRLTGNLEALAHGFERGCLGKRLDLQFEDLTYKLPDGKVILSGVTGHIQPGRVTAVMGPSGAGKTTFLNVLMGKVKRTGGSLFINGKEEEISKFKKVIGYVPQEDVMIRELTVKENIAFSAQIRLPTWTEREVEAHIDSVINTLGLDHVQHSLIGDEFTRGISGGQRKRVNIGLELAACPIALFLDEPTSGLDSTAALTVCKTLKAISSLGMNVVAVIHQPRYEIFESFDDILLLAPGGRTVYVGPQRGIIPYFQNLGFEFPTRINPADVLMDIVAGKVLPAKNTNSNNDPLDLVSIWESHALSYSSSDEYGTFRKGSINALIAAEEGGKKGLSLRDRIRSFQQDNTITTDSLEIIAQKRGAGFFHQILLCHNRSMVQQYRKIFSFGLELFVATLAGVLMGIASIEVKTNLYQGVLRRRFALISPSPVEIILPQLGLLIGMAIAIAGAPAGVLVFGEEKVVYWREAACGHNRLAYYIGKTLSTFARFCMSSLHFAACFYLLCRPLMDFSEFYAYIFLTFFGVYGLSAVVSMIVPRENAPLLAVISALIFATMSGYGPTLRLMEEIYLKWAYGFSFNRWGAEAFYDAETRRFRNLYRVESVSAQYFGYTLDRFALDLGMMAILGVGLRVLAFFLLILTNRRKQT